MIFMRRHNYDRLKNVIKHIGKNLQQKTGENIKKLKLKMRMN